MLHQNAVTAQKEALLQCRMNWLGSKCDAFISVFFTPQSKLDAKYTEEVCADITRAWTCMHACTWICQTPAGYKSVSQGTELPLSGSWCWERKGGDGSFFSCSASLALQCLGCLVSAPPPLRKNTSDISWQWEHWWCCRGPNGACACVCVTHQHTEQTVVFRHYSSGNRSHIDNIYFAATQFRAELHACDFGLNGVSNDSQIIQPPFLTHVAALFVNLPPLF